MVRHRHNKGTEENEIERVTRNTYVIRKGGEAIAMPGCYPKTYKAAKAIIDDLAK